VAQFRYRKRTFLAPVSSRTTSYIVAEVESSDGGTYELGTYMLMLADCRRSIELEFALTTAYSRKKSLAKVDLLFEVLSAFREGLHAEATLIEKRKARTK
jgi:hypothetical protein